MISIERHGIRFLQFPNLMRFSDIKHGVFTRYGGHSTGPHRGLNISFGTGDEEDHVRRNRMLIARCLAEQDLVFAHQNHGSVVLVLTKDPKGHSADEAQTSLVGDALVTDNPQKVLVIQVADCQAVLLYDPVRRVIANVHSGWRGSIKNIIGRTLSVMGEVFDCRTRDIIAGIGPSLGPCCAEFVNYANEIPPTFWKYKDALDHFDFWSLSRDQLRDAGLQSENICLSNLCTRCNTDRFFSYRGEGITGRFAAVIGLT